MDGMRVGSQDGRYLKPQSGVPQDLKRCFLFVNNTLGLVFFAVVVFCFQKYYKRPKDPWYVCSVPNGVYPVVNTKRAHAVSFCARWI